jgi:hypothetical protein
VSYLRERGVLARVVETESDVVSPRVIINGHEIKDMRQAPRGERAGMFPTIRDIAAAIDRHLWSL